MRIVSVRRIDAEHFEVIRHRGWFRITREWACVRWSGNHQANVYWADSADIVCDAVSRAVHEFVRREEELDAVRARDGHGRWHACATVAPRRLVQP
jgi:hypothetical protein